jgi:hypothetical protein
LRTCSSWKMSTCTKVERCSVSIFQNYIPNNAPLCINISSQTRKDLIEKFKTIPEVSFESYGKHEETHDLEKEKEDFSIEAK